MIPPRKTQIIRGVLPSQRWLWRAGYWRVKNYAVYFVQQIALMRLLLIPRVNVIFRSRRLVHQLGQKNGRQSKGVVVVAAHFGTHNLLRAFLDHHRRIGIQNFVFLDLSTDGELCRHLKDETGCAVWRPANMKTEVNNTFWLNALRSRYARRRWCLSLDTSDAFIFYRCESRKISDFTEFLEAECRDHAFGVLVEMYGDFSIAAPPTGPEDLRYFDSFGFVSREKGHFRNPILRGGPQRRILYNLRSELSPAVNRVPLIRWRWNYSYVCGTKVAKPPHLNHPHARWHSSPTCCVLRYALLCDTQTLDTAARWESLSNLTEPTTSGYAGTARLLRVQQRHDYSRLFKDTQDFVDSGLLNPGQWF